MIISNTTPLFAFAAGTLLKGRQHGLIPAFLPLVRQLQASGFRYHGPLVVRLAALVGES